MTKFIYFKTAINSISLPNTFDYPYNYTPHTLAKIAAEELQEYLKIQSDFSHNFGIKNPNSKDALGKMFGVLVVKNLKGEIGYLASFSGKLANSTQHKYFVPPVYDVLEKNGFYLKTEEKLNQINKQISEIENSIDYQDIKSKYLTTISTHESLLSEEHTKFKERRKLRRLKQQPDNQLNINEEFYLREYEVYLDDKIQFLKNEYLEYKEQLNDLLKLRKKVSAEVQQEIFKNYTFLNNSNEEQNLLDIFKDSTQNIPTGAGDCCAPKLLQYAYQNDLTPICMAEFWWGKSSKTYVRKHQYFYPACTGKCKPILTHMLQGIIIGKNPLYTQLKIKKEISIIYEDKLLAVINKPHDLLSVPGKEIIDSVYTRMKNHYPNATGPLVVHRLDMSTSGILLIAKNEDTYKALQAQFINRTIHKRYVALLNGKLSENKGKIDLPLRVDLDDRPKQLVCDAHGKKAFTKWEVIEIKNNKTKVYFYPITGRTHQLRVHAAHSLGLNTPIIGDDLYGQKNNRLYLHAESITFVHPKTKERMSISSPTPF